jgi:Bacteriophage tail sheath protein
VTADPGTGAGKLIPPGGHVLGVYARTDSERGVFKAPANEVLRGVLDLEFAIDDNTQDVLNPRGVNVTRSFPGRGILVWGARTISSNALWKYVSVRRLFIFLERSIYEGTQWVVFEPNDDRLWARVVDTIRGFLRDQWRLGALFGRTEQEAFFIICDRTTMTLDDILNGRLICEIGIAPVRPAEFVVFRIFQSTAESQR